MVAKKDNNDEGIFDNFYQINHYIHEIHDLTTRVDERVKTVFKQLSETDIKLEKLRDNYSMLVSKMNSVEIHELPCVNKKVLELKSEIEKITDEFKFHMSKLQKFETDAKDLKNFKRSTEDKVRLFVDVTFKLILTIGCSFIAYKLGWNK